MVKYMRLLLRNRIKLLTDNKNLSFSEVAFNRKRFIPVFITGQKEVSFLKYVVSPLLILLTSCQTVIDSGE